jgi:hypothetical protein
MKVRKDVGCKRQAAGKIWHLALAVNIALTHRGNPPPNPSPLSEARG